MAIGMAFYLPFVLAWRELRGSLRDFRLFLACLFIGTAVIAAVGSMSQNIRQSIFNEAKTFLGGDVSLTQTNQAATPEEVAFLSSWGRVSEAVDMRAMAAFQDDVVLVELKGVDTTYPLVGELTNSDKKEVILKPNEILVGPELLERLNVKVGDSLLVGPAHFLIAGTIGTEPDHMSGAFSLGPRVLARTQDLAQAGLLGPDELLHYHDRVLLGEGREIGSFLSALKMRYPQAGWTILTYNDANQSTGRFVDRLQLFLTLAGLSTLLIGGVGVMNATNAYMTKKIASIAIFKAIGASVRQVFLAYGLLLTYMTFVGAGSGAMAGGIVARAVLPYLAKFFPVSTDLLFYPSALLGAMWFGALTVTVFALTALSRCSSVQPSILLRNAGGHVSGKISRPWIAINSCLVFLLVGSLIGSAVDRKIAMGFVLAAILCVSLLTGISRLIQSVARSYTYKTPWARLAGSNITRPGSATFSVILSVGIGLTVLIALLVVEGNFRQELKTTLPALAPSLFFVDVQADQLKDFSDMLQKQPGVSDVALKPMIRGRIESLNGIPADKIKVRDDAKWALESDRGLSYATEPPAKGLTSQGKWWDKDYRGPTLVSLDQKLAKGMGIKVGDHMGLNIAGQSLDVTVANLRNVDYMTLQINFSLILSPGAIERFPVTFLGTAHVADEASKREILRAINNRFPNISSIDVRDQIDTFSRLVDQISFAIRVIAMVSLVSGSLVLASALTATLDRRTYEITIFKVLGASRADIMRSFLAEWIALASVTAVVSAALGSAGAWLILYALDWVDYSFLPVTVFGTIGGAICVMLIIGTFIHSQIFSRPGLSMLRNE